MSTHVERPDLTDDILESWVREDKPMPKENWHRKRKTRCKHEQVEIELQAVSGRTYAIYLRQSTITPADFSVGLRVCTDSGEWITLRRYNGAHGAHENRLERESISGCHVHRATERYIAKGHSAEAYAEATNRYATVEQALQCLYQDCGFLKSHDQQSSLFDEPAN